MAAPDAASSRVAVTVTSDPSATVAAETDRSTAGASSFAIVWVALPAVELTVMSDGVGRSLPVRRPSVTMTVSSGSVRVSPSTRRNRPSLWPEPMSLARLVEASMRRQPLESPSAWWVPARFTSRKSRSSTTMSPPTLRDPSSCSAVPVVHTSRYAAARSRLFAKAGAAASVSG